MIAITAARRRNPLPVNPRGNQNRIAGLRQIRRLLNRAEWHRRRAGAGIAAVGGNVKSGGVQDRRRHQQQGGKECESLFHGCSARFHRYTLGTGSVN